jgi:glycosyltransferase involved in cell wall biosynthesis
MAKNADSIITVSNFAKQELCDIMSINENKIHVVYNGVNDLFFDPSPGKPFTIPDDYFLYVGNLNENKNISGLINGYLHARREHDLSQDLMLIGGNKDGIYNSVDKSTIEKSNYIHRFDYKSQEELKYAYDNASAFVHPSFYESCPLVAIEAMARGLPSVSSDRGGLPEIFDEAAIYFDPQDKQDLAKKLSRISSRSSLRNQLSKKAEIRSQQFKWDRAADQVMEILNNQR